MEQSWEQPGPGGISHPCTEPAREIPCELASSDSLAAQGFAREMQLKIRMLIQRAHPKNTCTFLYYLLSQRIPLEHSAMFPYTKGFYSLLASTVRGGGSGGETTHQKISLTHTKSSGRKQNVGMESNACDPAEGASCCLCTGIFPLPRGKEAEQGLQAIAPLLGIPLPAGKETKLLSASKGLREWGSAGVGFCGSGVVQEWGCAGVEFCRSEIMQEVVVQEWGSAGVGLCRSGVMQERGSAGVGLCLRLLRWAISQRSVWKQGNSRM